MRFIFWVVLGFFWVLVCWFGFFWFFFNTDLIIWSILWFNFIAQMEEKNVWGFFCAKWVLMSLWRCLLFRRMTVIMNIREDVNINIFIVLSRQASYWIVWCVVGVSSVWRNQRCIYETLLNSQEKQEVWTTPQMFIYADYWNNCLANRAMDHG